MQLWSALLCKEQQEQHEIQLYVFTVYRTQASAKSKTCTCRKTSQKPLKCKIDHVAP